MAMAGGKDPEKLDEALASPAEVDVLIDYTKPDSVKARTLEALARGLRVLTAGAPCGSPKPDQSNGFLSSRVALLRLAGDCGCRARVAETGGTFGELARRERSTSAAESEL